ncbi:MAG: hypothetical protein RLZZ360_646 [Candidatus Parcubacteria bacterium]|jgi:5'-deoxynucleotidase YfbR-like HD superfamily hydrolase
MTIEEIKNKILTDNAFVQNEIDTLVSYYQLKHTIRWAHKRTQEDETESVAEHVYALHVLIDYFFPLVDKGNMDLDKIRHMATWHDMAEAFVGDMTTRTKTKEHEENEKIAEANIVKNSPSHMTAMLVEIYAEFDKRESVESKFVKALDKIEPNFHLSFLSKKEKDYTKYFNLGWTADEYRAHRHPFVSEFPIIKRFDDILYERNKNYHPEK